MTDTPLKIIKVHVPSTPKVVSVRGLGLQGPPGLPGPTGPQGNRIFVSNTPPDDPQLHDIWIAIP